MRESFSVVLLAWVSRKEAAVTGSPSKEGAGASRSTGSKRRRVFESSARRSGERKMEEVGGSAVSAVEGDEFCS
jgi:hypothetical protein